MKEREPVQTAGILLPEERDGVMHVWLVVTPEDACDPRAADQDWLENEAHLQIPKGHAEPWELVRTDSDGTKVFDLEETGRREGDEEVGFPLEILDWIATYKRMAKEYDEAHEVSGEAEKEVTVFRARRLQGPQAPPRESHVKAVCVPADARLWSRMVYPQDAEIIGVHLGLERPAEQADDLADIAVAEA